jgi:hypothetical protein
VTHKSEPGRRRAEQYFEQDLGGQRRWYSERASSYKQRTQVLGLLVIGTGALTSFSPNASSAASACWRLARSTAGSWPASAPIPLQLSTAPRNVLARLARLQTARATGADIKAAAASSWTTLRSPRW